MSIFFTVAVTTRWSDIVDPNAVPARSAASVPVRGRTLSDKLCTENSRLRAAWFSVGTLHLAASLLLCRSATNFLTISFQSITSSIRAPPLEALSLWRNRPAFGSQALELRNKGFMDVLSGTWSSVRRMSIMSARQHRHLVLYNTRTYEKSLVTRFSGEGVVVERFMLRMSLARPNFHSMSDCIWMRWYVSLIMAMSRLIRTMIVITL